MSGCSPCLYGQLMCLTQGHYQVPVKPQNSDSNVFDKATILNEPYLTAEKQFLVFVTRARGY